MAVAFAAFAAPVVCVVAVVVALLHCISLDVLLFLHLLVLLGYILFLLYISACSSLDHVCIMAKLTPQGGRQILRLKIGDAPKNPFVGHEFTINIHLVDDSGQLKCGYVRCMGEDAESATLLCDLLCSVLWNGSVLLLELDTVSCFMCYYL